MSISDCPCGSGVNRASCCGPFLDGAAHAPTAVALMRSRYTAHVERNVAYLQRTAAPRVRGGGDDQPVRWLGLTVLETTGGGTRDETGTVTFEARYDAGGGEQLMHERSRFARADGRWTYTSGEVGAGTVRRQAPRVGRNQKCPCGSGKKYKRCCGRAGSN